MKITVSVDSLSIELCAESVENLVGSLSESEEYKDFYRVLAAHPSSGVRSAIASKDKIDAETVRLLSQDPVPNVRLGVLVGEAGRAHLTEAQLTSLAEGDLVCAETIAGNLGAFQLESDNLAQLLAKHTDPKVRQCLASNYNVPKRLLKQLLRDPDPQVRRSAQSSLD